MRADRTILFCLLVIAGTAACGSSGDASGQGTSTAAASGKPASGAPAAAGGKTTRFKHVQDECTFELDAPEELKQSAKDGMSTTFKGATVWFQGYAGSSLYGLDQLTGLATMGETAPPLHKGSEGGVNLVVSRKPKADPPNAVMGQGEEAVKGRSIGCSFLCGGTKEREADVIALCKSVRITFDESKAK